MAKSRSVYVCQQCGFQSPSFLGRCPECGTWNSLVEQVEESNKKDQNIVFSQQSILRLSDIKKQEFDRLSSNIKEFDRVLGGGIVPGSVILVAGDPGIGKSTLLSQLALNIKDVLYVAGEESAQQIKIRIDRIKKGADLLVFNEVDVDVICRAVEQTKPSLVIVDSIQTLESSDLVSAAGSVGQVRESAHRLQRLAKKLHIPLFIVGHVTKEGSVAGPKTLEHIVDVVLSLEGDPSSQFRVLRANKNRFGPTDEVGIFEMAEAGMIEVSNPSEVFIEHKVDEPGSATVVVMNGLRPILLEVQSLVTKTSLAIPRRVGNGVDNNRLQLLVAVLTKKLNLKLFDQDIFVNVTGGLKINDSSADLGICAAITSSFLGKEIVPKSVFIGEVGLLGELRPIKQLEKRSKEAKLIGFDRVISFAKAKTLSQALRLGLKEKQI